MPDVKTFSVLDAIKGRSYPSDSVTVYTDVESLYELARLEKQIADAPDGESANALEPQVEDLKDKIKKSALTFELRGFSFGVWDSIDKEAQAMFGNDADISEGEAKSWRKHRYIAESIIRVTNADGAVDESRWGIEDVKNLEALLPMSEFSKLEAMTSFLSMASLEFDQAVTPDFS